MTKEEREMQRYEVHLAACRQSLRDMTACATGVAQRAGASVHPRVKAIKKTAAPSTAVVPQQQTSGSNISNNCPQNTTQEKT